MMTFRPSKTLLLACLFAACVARGVVAAAAQETPSNDSSHRAIPTRTRGVHDFYGTVRSVNGSQFTLETRTERTIQVDATTALETSRGLAPAAGRTVGVHGAFDNKGVLHAELLFRAKNSSAMWPADR
jgi:Domain of unknown function (DUF5666)